MTDVSHLVEAVGAEMRRVADLARSAQTLQARLAELRGQGFSDHDDVVAWVDRRGFVVDLSFADSALDEGPDQLAAALKQAVSAAIADVRAQADMIRREVLGDAPIRYDKTFGEQLDALSARIDARMGGNER